MDLEEVLSKDSKKRRNWTSIGSLFFSGLATVLAANNYAAGRIGLPLLGGTVALFAVAVLLAWVNRSGQAPQAKRES
ncbi:MAG: hypothetical protein EOR63_32195 [Mesorhizobium sp.]|nr:MAG: hypothetical protein EOR63_32195 [Mesorhizobium sp.]